MSGNKAGAKKAAAVNLERDPDFYRRISKLAHRRTGHAFAYGKVDPVIIGTKGGTISKRGKAKKDVPG